MASWSVDSGTDTPHTASMRSQINFPDSSQLSRSAPSQVCHIPNRVTASSARSSAAVRRCGQALLQFLFPAFRGTAAFGRIQK